MFTFQCMLSVEGTKFGYSTVNNRIPAAAATTAVHVNAQLSDVCRHTNTTVTTCAATTAASISQVQFLPCSSCAQSPKSATNPVTGNDNQEAKR